MVCIYCGSKTQVTNSRHQKRHNNVWRRRECLNCHAVFTTEESVEYSGSIVVRSDHSAGTSRGKGSRKATRAVTGLSEPSGRIHTSMTPFSRDKLYVSVLKCLGHRAAAVEDATALTSTIIARLLLQTDNGALTSTIIIDTTHEVLYRFDRAAAVQYRAYHHS